MQNIIVGASFVNELSSVFCSRHDTALSIHDFYDDVRLGRGPLNDHGAIVNTNVDHNPPNVRGTTVVPLVDLKV